MEFERPLVELEDKLDELRSSIVAANSPTSPRRSRTSPPRSSGSASRRTGTCRRGTASRSSRHPDRPKTQHYVEALFTDVVELHGDRHFGDDEAILAGARARSAAAASWCSATARAPTPRRTSSATSAARIPRASARRCASCDLAEKFGLPVVTFLDTAGRVPGHRGRGARPGVGDRRVAREALGAARAGRRRRHRRGRQRWSARDRLRRPAASCSRTRTTR